MNCFGYLIILAFAAFSLLTLLRLFEQITEAIRQRWWNKTILLLACPFAVWLFPSRVSAGRPTPVARHEPVRGFGAVSKQKPPVIEEPNAPVSPQRVSPLEDGPPPGTPAAFLVKPEVPPKKAKPGKPVDEDKIAKLRQKMREQGMLGDE